MIKLVINRLSLLSLLVFFIGCAGDSTNGKGITISGNIENVYSESFAHLELVTENGIETVDTLELDENGNFNQKVEISEPAFYRINFNNRQIISLILSGKEEEVTVNAHGNSPQGFSEISGSYDTEYKRQMDEIVQEFQIEAKKYQQQQLLARSEGDAVTFNAISNELRSYAEKTEKKLMDVIREATPSLAAFYGLRMIDGNKNSVFVDSVATALLEEMPNNFHVLGMLSTLEQRKRLAVGAAAPEVSLPNREGEIITLSSLRGKYVLIDFWAAWCRPCRAENPNVVRVYNEYGGDQFEILGVSLDKTREAWLKAIEQDGLPWLHVSDLKFWNSEAAKSYEIHSIPATYLINPDGIIIAKNLRGASLEAKLKEIFG